MSQHKHPTVWQFLRTLIETVEFERQRHSDTMPDEELKTEDNTLFQMKLSDRYSEFSQALDSQALMTRHDH